MKVIVVDFNFAGLAYSTSCRIVDKLRKAGAVSIDKAVTPEAAKLNFEEIDWLGYLAGGFLATIKKTKNGRYYI